MSAAIEAPLSVAYLDGVRLRRALQAGIHRVISRQDYLNKINVFPVPDGDTGTNIAFTLNAVLVGLQGTVERHCGKLLTVVADSAIDGARGNSGAILAQFFQGLSDVASNDEELSGERFAEAVRAGAQYAREALSEPREGTLITVLRDFGDALHGYVQGNPQADFIQIIEHGLEHSVVSLNNTPNQLAVLKKAGVVDAGAAGFVDLLRGVHDFAKNGSLRQIAALAVVTAAEDADAGPGGHDDDLTHRYCTECMVTGTEIDRRHLREELSAIGSSLVLAGSKSKAKVHIHVNEPKQVFAICARFGAVSGMKADDMLQQTREARDEAGGVAVITDSGADIPDAEMERLNLHMVPVRVHFGDVGYLDKVALTSSEFYRLLDSEPHHPKTSQPPPGDFRRQFQFLGSHYDAVVSINLTARASGTWQSAQTAATRADGAAVKVVDSRSVSCGQGLLVMYAGECAQAGMDADGIVAAVQAMRPRTHVWGMLKDLTYGVRGGRVAKSKKVVADLLHLTPVLTANLDGFVKPGGVLFGRRQTTERFARFLLRRLAADRDWRLLVGHCNSPEEAERLAGLLRAALPRIESLHLVEVGPALGAHAGPGALVVGAQDYQPPVR